MLSKCQPDGHDGRLSKGCLLLNLREGGTRKLDFSDFWELLRAHASTVPKRRERKFFWKGSPLLNLLYQISTKLTFENFHQRTLAKRRRRTRTEILQNKMYLFHLVNYLYINIYIFQARDVEAWGCVMFLNCRFTVLVSFAFHMSKWVTYIYGVRDNDTNRVIYIELVTRCMVHVSPPSPRLFSSCLDTYTSYSYIELVTRCMVHVSAPSPRLSSSWHVHFVLIYRVDDLYSWGCSRAIESWGRVMCLNCRSIVLFSFALDQCNWRQYIHRVGDIGWHLYMHTCMERVRDTHR